MRRVMFKSYQGPGQPFTDLSGLFHCWGTETGDPGEGNYSVAIIEVEGGKIYTPCAHHVTFIDPPGADEIQVTQDLSNSMKDLECALKQVSSSNAQVSA